MKTFKQFLEESYETHPDENIHQNQTYIGGNKVKTSFIHIYNGHYIVYYSVNSQTDKKYMDNKPIKIKEAIARHAGNVVHHFIKNHKPNSLTYTPANKGHDLAFTKFSKKLADHHNYEYSIDKSGYQTLIKKK